MDVGTMNTAQIEELDKHIKQIVNPVIEENMAKVGIILKNQFDLLVSEASKLNGQMPAAQDFAQMVRDEMIAARLFADEVVQENTKMKSILEENDNKVKACLRNITEQAGSEL